MPELPEVESIRRSLEKIITGKQVVSVAVHLPRIIRSGRLDELSGRKISGVRRRGKYLIFETDSNLRMYAHLRMTGVFLWKEAEFNDISHVRAVLKFKEGFLLYRDPRTLGGLWIMDRTEHPWKQLGWEPFDPALDEVELFKLLSRRSINIKSALLKQEIIAGVGNIYASETLFDCGIDPRRSASDLSLPELKRLLLSLRNILSASIAASGTTFRDFRLSDGRNGEFANFLKVYAKAGKPCERCKLPIERIVQSQRSTYYCPKCQS